jgi:hypothetical protein
VVRSLIAREVPIDQDVFGEEYQRKATSHGKCRGKERVRRTGGAADQVVVSLSVAPSKFGKRDGH